jgi:hypothetical protein
MADEPRNLVITIHGIRTFGQWQKRLATLIRKCDPATNVVSYKYGYFSAIAFLIPPLRWLATRRFRLELERIARNHPNTRLNVVAHSFGTHMVGWGLYRIPKHRRPRINTIVLAGSVLKPEFQWAELIDGGTVYRVINDCGNHDWILVLSQIVVLFTGMAGRIGFSGRIDDRFMNRFFNGGHSHYFRRKGQEFDDFMSRYWVPVLTTNQPPEEVDQRESTGSLQGILITVLQNFEPVKLTIYFLLLATPAFTYYQLRVAAETERQQRIRAELETERQRRAAAEQREIAQIEGQKAKDADQAAEVERQNAAHAKLRAELEGKLAQEQELKTLQMAALFLSEGSVPETNQAKINALKKAQWVFGDIWIFDFDRLAPRLSPEGEQIVRGFVLRLANLGYKGNLHVYGYIGRFCVIHDSSGDPRLAPETLPIAKCKFWPDSDIYAQGLAERRAASVKTYLVRLSLLPVTRIVTIGFSEWGATRKPRHEYPSQGNAGQWNRVARLNNRVELIVE